MEEIELMKCSWENQRQRLATSPADNNEDNQLERSGIGE